MNIKVKPKDDTLYAVRRIVSERIAKTTGARQFLVEWEGARADGTAWRNSWEHASNLTDDLWWPSTTRPSSGTRTSR